MTGNKTVDKTFIPDISEYLDCLCFELELMRTRGSKIDCLITSPGDKKLIAEFAQKNNLNLIVNDTVMPGRIILMDSAKVPQF